MRHKYWDGKTVHFTDTETLHDRRSFDLAMTGFTARKLAISLARLKQTTITLPPEVEEILTALNYVLIGDPASEAAHRRMEASKGMEPATSTPPAQTAEESTDPKLRALRTGEVEQPGFPLGSRRFNR